MLSLETCEKLKAAGWPQGIGSYRNFLEPIACPTLEELLKAIRGLTESKHRFMTLRDSGNCWIIEVEDMTDDNWDIWDGITVAFQSPSEAAASLWLKLKETHA